ncbi:protein of unknown function [Xenorhabdus poinarii G6]|uniref:Uncharacterized protein n=1 Tax=Xenorhabdus poinarii G6 TaxID=1354304 RepID=A0A068R428_9GAMM|nr:protein of unknown function [Xenorhabdus poinarii G6]
MIDTLCSKNNIQTYSNYLKKIHYDERHNGIHLVWIMPLT